MRGYTETLMADTGCTTCLCPEEVADENSIKVVELDPYEPVCKDVQGNKLNMIRPV